MNTSATLSAQLAHSDTLAANALLAALAGWWRGVIAARGAAASQRRSLDTAAALIARAGHYEASQPSFAADLRAAAASLKHQAGLRS